MTHFTYTLTNSFNVIPLNIKIRQIYIWLKTLDNKFLLVSKNGTKYQQPGGHPELNENINQTIIRELKEEAGLDLVEDNLEDLKLIGYYAVTEDNQTYLQLRFFLKLNKDSSEYRLQPVERETEKEEDKIKYAKFFTIEEACNVISWLKGSDELKSLIS